MFLHKSYHRELNRTSSFLLTHSLSISTGEQTTTTTLQFFILNKRTAKTTDLTYANLYTMNIHTNRCAGLM